ncbi:hypothetical protein [Polaromonas sp.]|uniref:hypothetical protein n=1 Tax=Polaromonas sp. TaxID=1869339 RepID=UPI00352B6EBB
MNAIARCLQAASHQFVANAQPTILAPRAKALVMASALVVLAAVTVSPAAKAQYVWGNGGQNTSNNDRSQPVISQNSVSRWGEVLGGVVGRAAGTSMAGSAGTTAIGRTVQNAVSGMSEEVGRNLGRSAATEPFRSANNIPAAESDYIDTAGLNAIFAHGQAAQQALTGRRNSPDYQNVMAARDRTLREFDLAIRASANRGFNVGQWTQVRSMLLRPVGTTPEPELVAQGQTMSGRLYRQGGPGYRLPTSYATTSLEDMRINMQGRGQPGVVYQNSPQ